MSVESAHGKVVSFLHHYSLWKSRNYAILVNLLKEKLSFYTRPSPKALILPSSWKCAVVVEENVVSSGSRDRNADVGVVVFFEVAEVPVVMYSDHAAAVFVAALEEDNEF